MKKIFFDRIVVGCFVITIVICIIFSGCTPVYVPNTLNTHIPKNAGETYISGHTLNNDVDFATTLAISDNVAMLLNGSLSKVNAEGSRDFHKHDFFEGGVSYTSKLKRKIVTGANISYGKGTSETYYNFPALKNDTTLSSAEFNRFAMQMLFGYKAKNGAIIGSARLSYVQFTTLYIPSTTLQILHLPYTGIFFEPAVTIKFGIPSLMGVVQTGILLNLNKNISFSYQKYFTSVGIEFAIIE